MEAYVEMRRDARTQANQTFTSARTLLALLRLSTALVCIIVESVQHLMRSNFHQYDVVCVTCVLCHLWRLFQASSFSGYIKLALVDMAWWTYISRCLLLRTNYSLVSLLATARSMEICAIDICAYTRLLEQLIY